MARRTVVFPLPLGPSSVTRLPGSMVSEMSSTARTSVPKVLVTERSSIEAVSTFCSFTFRCCLEFLDCLGQVVFDEGLDLGGVFADPLVVSLVEALLCRSSGEVEVFDSGDLRLCR